MKKFFITGVSGTGKSTVGEELARRDIPIIDLDHVKDLCKWINQDTGERAYWQPGIGREFFEKNRYICDKEMLKSMIDSHEGKEAVGVVGLADNLGDIIGLFDKFFLFQCLEETFLKRITERKNHNFGKDDSEKEMLLSWYKDYEKEMLDKGAILINTEVPVNAVVEKIIQNIRS